MQSPSPQEIPNDNQTEVGNIFFLFFLFNKKITKAISTSALFPELNHSIFKEYCKPEACADKQLISIPARKNYVKPRKTVNLFGI